MYIIVRIEKKVICKKLKIATLGCSHSSYYAGIPWPIPLAKITESELNMSYSAGAGNEMNVAKLNQILDEKNPDLVIVQLTDPNRLVLGLDYESCHRNVIFEDLIGIQNTKNTTYYTFNHTENIENLKKLLGKRFHDDLDNFIIEHVMTSEYNLYHKIVHTMCAMESLARSYNTPIIFFSWSVDIHKIIKENGYEKATKDFHIIPGYVEDFVAKNDLKPIAEGFAFAHHDTKNHIVIMYDYILPYLVSNNFITKPTLELKDIVEETA